MGLFSSVVSVESGANSCFERIWICGLNMRSLVLADPLSRMMACTNNAKSAAVVSRPFLDAAGQRHFHACTVTLAGRRSRLLTCRSAIQNKAHTLVLGLVI